MASFTLYVHPGSFSCWSIELLLAELKVEFDRQLVNLHSGEQFRTEFLALSPRGIVPVLQSEKETLFGAENIRAHLRSAPQFAGATIFGAGDLPFLERLESAPVGLITYGLAFHQENTKLLRYPYSDGRFFEVATQYILGRASALEDAALSCSNPQVADQLLLAAQEHQRRLPIYLGDSEYNAALMSVTVLLDHFEEELAREREGLWLGGILFSVADISLGLLLHRLWQLGMEREMFEEGVRPHLALYYNRLRRRESFKLVTRIEIERGELALKDDTDSFVEKARLGVGMMLVMGALYAGKKIFRK